METKASILADIEKFYERAAFNPHEIVELLALWDLRLSILAKDSAIKALKGNRDVI